MGVLLSQKLKLLGNGPNNVYQAIQHPPLGATNIHTWSETDWKWDKQNANKGIDANGETWIQEFP